MPYVVRPRIVACLICGLALITGGSSVARADIMVTNIAITPLSSGAEYDYTLGVSPTQEVTPQNPGPGPGPGPGPFSIGPQAVPDFFTIYDFVGYTGTHAQPAGWVLSTQNVGITPAGLASPPPDDPNIVNLTWTYTNGPIIVGPTIVALFAADSIYAQFQTGFWAGLGTLQSDGVTTKADSGTTLVPFGSSPEPSSLVLAASGALIALSVAWRSSRARRG